MTDPHIFGAADYDFGGNDQSDQPDPRWVMVYDNEGRSLTRGLRYRLSHPAARAIASAIGHDEPLPYLQLNPDGVTLDLWPTRSAS